MPRPDNTNMLRRIRANGVKRQANKPLGDYIQDLPFRVMEARGGAGQEGTGLGPLSAPVALGPELGLSTEQLLKLLLDQLRRLPQLFSLEWRTRFPMQPRESISFLTPTVSVAVPALTAVVVVSQIIPERYSGFITNVGVNVTPPASFPNITWQVRVNGAIHPEFANRIFMANTLATPMPFLMELTQARTVELVAINTAAAAITVQGVLAGWTEFLSDFKPYGSSPAGGV